MAIYSIKIPEGYKVPDGSRATNLREDVNIAVNRILSVSAREAVQIPPGIHFIGLDNIGTKDPTYVVQVFSDGTAITDPMEFTDESYTRRLSAGVEAKRLFPGHAKALLPDDARIQVFMGATKDNSFGIFNVLFWRR